MGSFLRKFGYLKLRHYGLQLDEHNRVITFRDPTIIAALGGATVGWTDQDSIAALAFSPAIMARSGQATPATGIATMSSVTMGAKTPGVAYINAQRSAGARLQAVPAAASPVASMSPTAIGPVVVRVAAPPLPANHSASASSPLVPPSEVPPSAVPVALAATAPAPRAPAWQAPAWQAPVESEPAEDEWEWVLALARAREADESPIVRPVRAVGSQPVATSAHALSAVPTSAHALSVAPTFGHPPLENMIGAARPRAGTPREDADRAEPSPDTSRHAAPNRQAVPSTALDTNAQPTSRMPRAQSPNADRLRARFARATTAPVTPAPGTPVTANAQVARTQAPAHADTTAQAPRAVLRARTIIGTPVPADPVNQTPPARALAVPKCPTGAATAPRALMVPTPSQTSRNQRFVEAATEPGQFAPASFEQPTVVAPLQGVDTTDSPHAPPAEFHAIRTRANTEELEADAIVSDAQPRRTTDIPIPPLPPARKLRSVTPPPPPQAPPPAEKRYPRGTEPLGPTAIRQTLVTPLPRQSRNHLPLAAAAIALPLVRR